MEVPAMQLVIHPGGSVSCLYDESLDLATLGPLTIRRGSHVKPDTEGQWRGDLSPVNGPRLGPFAQRSQALEAKREWLESNWLTSQAAAG
jgi:hypothetical protein